jgi:hypothetical protein
MLRGDKGSRFKIFLNTRCSGSGQESVLLDFRKDMIRTPKSLHRLPRYEYQALSGRIIGEKPHDNQNISSTRDHFARRALQMFIGVQK